MKAYVESLRINVCILSVLGLIAGAIISGSLVFTLIYASITAFLITGAGNLINDYFDYAIDKVNMPKRPIPSGRISRKNMLYFFILVNLIGLAFSFFVSLNFFIIALLNSIVLFLYSWKMKKTALLGNVLVSYLAASTFIAAALIQNTFYTIPLSIILLSAISFFGTMGREVLKDMEDIKGDRKEKASTLPILIGQKNARIFASFFLAIGIVMLFIPLAKNVLSIYYIIGLIPAVLLSFYALKTDIKKAQKSVKFAMLFALLGFILGSF